MPKDKENVAALYCRAIRDNPNIFWTDNSVLFCLLWDAQIPAKQMSHIIQHLKTKKHLSNENREKRETSTNQELLTTLEENSRRNRPVNRNRTVKKSCFV